MSDNIAHIALNTPLRRVFDYLCEGLDLEPGQRVELEFGKRKSVGIVVSSSDNSTFPREQLKPVLRCIDEHASISPALLKFILWAAHYYQHPLGEALFHALPARLRENKSIEHKDFLLWKPTEAGRKQALEALSSAPRQAEVMEILQKHPQGLGPKLCQTLGLKTQILRALENKGLAMQESQNRESLDRDASKTVLRNSPLKLNPEQESVLSAIVASPNQFHCFLLQGITGSGKTEVYLQAIEHCLKAGKQALVLIPEIGLTPQTIQRFQQRFACDIVALHSGLNDSERFKAWHKARQKQARIVIGTRSAIFAELPELGIIIVDEEHDASYKQQEGFRYSARDLAVVRGQRWQVPVILGSATPSLESLHNCELNKYQHLQLKERSQQQALPDIALQDIRQQVLQGGLSQKTIHKIREHLQAHNQVLVFINRRGYSPALICNECAWLATCPYCDARFTYHKSKQSLICHHCNFQQALISQCPQCHHGEMHALGQGTEKVEEILSLHFRHIPIIRIDRDSSTRKEALKQHLDFIQQGQPCILVGTQMLTKGHHFPKLTLVCIIDADQGFFSADFRAMERMGQTLIQISGRAGREQAHGEALLQTEMPDHPLLHILVKEGYTAFAQALMTERQSLAFPPYGYLCLIRADAPHIENSLHFLDEVKHCLDNSLANPEAKNRLRLMGPAPSSMQKKAGRHRAQLLLKATQRSELQSLLSLHMDELAKLPSARKVRWSVDIDPLDLF